MADNSCEATAAVLDVTEQKEMGKPDEKHGTGVTPPQTKMDLTNKDEAKATKVDSTEVLKLADSSASSPSRIEPIRKKFFPNSERWSNPEDWDFHILQKASNFNPWNSVPMLGKLLKSLSLSDSTEKFVDYDTLKNFGSDPNRMQILWVGHATLLVQMEGFNILTDPVFSDIAGPNRVMGYRRYRQPMTTVEELEKNGIEIHAVIISHNHYDHFDEQSISKLNESYPGLKWFVPMDLKEAVVKLGGKVVTQFKWWECGELGEGKDKLQFHFTPAKHWSGRGALDWYKTLWGSWIIKGKELTFFFAGDTGYQEEIFSAIKEEFKTIDVAALPIGAYEPREMVKCQHINPEEAVKIHKELGVKMSVGIHWGTFQLTTESKDQTKQDLATAMESHGLKEDQFQTLEDRLITTYLKAERGEEKSDESIYTPS